MQTKLVQCTCKRYYLDHVVLLDVVAEDLLLFTREENLRPPSRNTNRETLGKDVKAPKTSMQQFTISKLSDCHK